MFHLITYFDQQLNSSGFMVKCKSKDNDQQKRRMLKKSWTMLKVVHYSKVDGHNK